MRREIPVVIRKNGSKFVPEFPVELNAGDQLIITEEIMTSRVPKGKTWTVVGYNKTGPITSELDS